MNIEAHLNTLHISPRKVRVVVGMLPGLSVREAEHQLDRELRRAALPIRKLLLSAVSNAEHNFHAVPENLVVARVVVNEGKKLKRWMPRAQGRATPIWKRMSRVSLFLREVTPGVRAETSLKKTENTKKGNSSGRKHSKSSNFSGEANESGYRKKGSSARASRSIFHRKSV